MLSFPVLGSNIELNLDDRDTLWRYVVEAAFVAAHDNAQVIWVGLQQSGSIL